MKRTSSKSSRTDKPSVVLDTNVYISAVVFGGIPRQIITLAKKEEIYVYSSPDILLEVSNKLYEKFGWNQQQVESILQAISKTVTVIKPKSNLTVVKSDPTDNKIIECAFDAGAKYIITGDKHLLNLFKFDAISIVSPSEFLKRTKLISTLE